MSAMSSLEVMRSTKGFTTSGDSMSPMKMLEAVASVSAPEVRMVRCITHATPRTTACMTPQWYRTVIRHDTKMMFGRIWKAKKAPLRATIPGVAWNDPCPGAPAPTGTLSPTRLPKTKRPPSSA